MRAKNSQRLLHRRAVVLGATSALATGYVSGFGAAQDATPEISGHSVDEQAVSFEVLLTGLADPRFVVVDGSDVYFTESGTGGDEPLLLPEGEAPVSHFGRTGKVSKLSADGTVTEIASDLMSYTFGANGEIVGPAGLALDGEGSIYVSVGVPGPYIETMSRIGEEGVLLKVNIETGEHTVVADLVDWELSEDPDPMTFDSNPYGMALVDGVAYIADSGGNTIIAVDVDSGEISTFAVTGGLEAPFFGDTGNPLRQGAAEIDSVPSAVELGPDGRLYVAYVTGGPFPAGFAPVDAFGLDGEKERVVEGLTMTGDLAFDSAGRMYASIVSTDMINGGPGQVVRVEEDGTATVVIDGLAIPAGIAFDTEDNLYVINKSSVIPGGGELIRYSGLTNVAAGTVETEPDATPMAEETHAAGANTFHIDFVDTAFEPNELTIPANTDITFTFENKGFLAHDFVLADPKTVSDVLTNGGTTALVLNLSPGEYTFYCSQIGHRAMGMEGTLTVV